MRGGRKTGERKAQNDFLPSTVPGIPGVSWMCPENLPSDHNTLLSTYRKFFWFHPQRYLKSTLTYLWFKNYYRTNPQMVYLSVMWIFQCQLVLWTRKEYGSLLEIASTKSCLYCWTLFLLLLSRTGVTCCLITCKIRFIAILNKYAKWVWRWLVFFIVLGIP